MENWVKYNYIMVEPVCEGRFLEDLITPPITSFKTDEGIHAFDHVFYMKSDEEMMAYDNLEDFSMFICLSAKEFFKELEDEGFVDAYVIHFHSIASDEELFGIIATDEEDEYGTSMHFAIYSLNDDEDDECDCDDCCCDDDDEFDCDGDCENCDYYEDEDEEDEGPRLNKSDFHFVFGFGD